MHTLLLGSQSFNLYIVKHHKIVVSTQKWYYRRALRKFHTKWIGKPPRMVKKPNLLCLHHTLVVSPCRNSHCSLINTWHLPVMSVLIRYGFVVVPVLLHAQEESDFSHSDTSRCHSYKKLYRNRKKNVISFQFFTLYAHNGLSEGFYMKLSESPLFSNEKK